MKVKDLNQKHQNLTIYIEGKPIYKHSIDKAKESNKFKKIVLVINKNTKIFKKYKTKKY